MRSRVFTRSSGSKELGALITVVLLGWGGMHGCKRRAYNTTDTETRALKTKSVDGVTAAEDVLAASNAVDFLPVEYGVDYCYARSYYLGLALAARSIPSGQIIVVAPGNNNKLSPDGDSSITWGWHITPILRIAGAREPVVIDRAIENGSFSRPNNKGLFSVPDWIAEMRDEGGADAGRNHELSVYVYPASHFGPMINAKSETLEPSDQEGLTAIDFSSQKPFSFLAINSMCHYIAKNFAESVASGKTSASSAEQRLDRMREHLATLLPKLDARGKLEGFPAGEPLQVLCGADAANLTPFFPSPPDRWTGQALQDELELAKKEAERHPPMNLTISDVSGVKGRYTIGTRSTWDEFSKSWEGKGQAKRAD